MLDFFMISTRIQKRGTIEIYPKFIIKKSSDLMIRGGDFYAVWVEERGLWSTDEQDALRLIDEELDIYAKKKYSNIDSDIRVLHMWDAETGLIDKWHNYCKKQLRDSYHTLDEKLIFSNVEPQKTDYASKRLKYPLQKGTMNAYDKLISTLYSDEERHKIEWAIGSIVNGDSKKLQKFVVLYGSAGTGKSTILNIIQKLFDGYYSVFDAKALGSSTNAFALESFKSNPLVAIQHDGDLSKIEDNTRLNSLVAHELMTVNEKHKSLYSNEFKSFLFIGTNKPVKITDAKSGLIRRLIDVSPSGNKLPTDEYNNAIEQIDFELGAIAFHCLEVYNNNPKAYDNYIPIAMMGATNDFYNFVLDSYYVFKSQDETTLKAAWEMYKLYCDEARVAYPFSFRIFKEELKNYFWNFKERFSASDGTRVRNYYSGFRTDKFEYQPNQINYVSPYTLNLFERASIIDAIYAECPAQYATSTEKPYKKWDEVTSKLSDLDTHKLHYVKVPENHIVIDFDIRGDDGEKSLEKNIEAASKWPATYAELSKSGKGVHLHYIYSGDVNRLSRIYDENIEIKVFSGNSSLRRQLSKCNDLPIATISSGLPLKGENKMVNFEAIKNEKALRTLIKKNLNKEYHSSTKCSIDFIYKNLDDAYKSGINYDVTDMRNAVLAFAASSTNQSDYCIKLVNKMNFKSEDTSEPIDSDNKSIIFYDVEVFPNLFLVNWKMEGPEKPVVRMINPTPTEIEELMKFRLVGFNCRRYDNHILYARLMGYTNEQLYNLSQKIINGSPNCFFGEAYNVSYTDVYDFSSKKQSLKKFEIELGIHHQELGLPWDKPVPEDMWEKVAEYCDNDVIATEAVFNDRKSDFIARQVLADVAGMTVNDTTNSLSTRIIFGKNRKPQDQFNYRDMGDIPDEVTNFNVTKDLTVFDFGSNLDEPAYTLFDKDGRPVFPGYTFDHGKSIYRGEEVGEGGYVYSEPGIYTDVALLDIASMHPSSVIAENLFGDVYTKRFEELVMARLAIKHKDFDKARKMLNGSLSKYLTDEDSASDLAQALKIVINSVYGLTSASFENPFRDTRNIDNIVAKRGALFMINLKHEVQAKGFTVAHIKTDSIKIPNATPEIIQFVMDYGQMYGYNFEHEATYDRMCLIDKAVYIAKYKDGDWTATGTKFAVPYVFKTLFSKEKIELGDMCETKQVSTSLYLDFNEELPDVSSYETELDNRVFNRLYFDSTLYKNPRSLNPIFKNMSDDELLSKTSEGHNYHFIGKVGLFCPIKEGCGGGILLRESTDKKTGEIKYDAVSGSKGYRWHESEMVKELHKENDIDRSYYDKLVDDAIETIDKYGDFEKFVSEEPYIDKPPWDE